MVIAKKIADFIDFGQETRKQQYLVHQFLAGGIHTHLGACGPTSGGTRLVLLISTYNVV